MAARRVTEPISDLVSHIQKLNAPSPNRPDIKIIDEEFNFLESRTEKFMNPSYCSSASLSMNDEKNRYPDVLPADEFRVKLNPIPGVAGSDYINASYIMSPMGDKRGYICSQGPLENTVNDFWRMVYEQEVKVFAMLTKEIEKEQQKSIRYWPEGKNEAKLFGDNQVTLLSMKPEDPTAEFIERELSIFNVKEGITRNLFHIQYQGWPDHGIPESTDSFLELVKKVNEALTKRGGGPIGLHCSAGIGRTGTFCAVDINIKILKEHFKTKDEPPPLNLVNTVFMLRKQRPGMVQTKEQFLFCYQAIEVEYKRLREEARLRKSQQ